MKNFLGLLVCVFIIGTSGIGNANMITGSGDLNLGEIDDVYFSVTTAGFFNINVWDDPITFGDPEINLFNDDGALSMDDFIENDDDGGTGYDSYIGRNLLVGNYLLRVSSYNFGDSSGSNSVIIADTNSSFNSYAFDFDYSIASCNGVVVAGGAPVPEPATMLLFGLGLLGLAGVNRKKQ